MKDSNLDAYRAATGEIPARMLRWHLYGAGLENLGKEGRPEEVDVPEYGPDELLVRQDACGLCFSDTKVIALGPNHPRMTGRDLATDPVTLGHEVSCTVVGVGAELKERFHVGQRFVVQADVFYKGKSMAYGYAIRGGLAEYSLIPKPVIDGDEGCYLLPIKEKTGYAESALTEPWACVVSAYAQKHRAGVKPGGRQLILAGEGVSDAGCSAVLKAAGAAASVVLIGDLSCPPAAVTPGIVRAALPTDWAEFKQAHTSGEGFDDIFILGRTAPETGEGVAITLADHGVVNFVGDPGFSRKLSIDVGRIHYNWHYYLGTASSDPSDGYVEPREASDLLAGGIAWLIGAGGPMGQMHVQRAVQHRNPPRRIVATDVDAGRLQSVADRFADIARERGIELVVVNPKELGEQGFNAELRRLSEARGFDDIVCMVPVPAIIEHAADYLADGGYFNIFAGVARGTMANLDVNAIVRKRVRFFGSSGSSLSDMRETLARVESAELSTNASLAAVGGMVAVKEGLQAVKEGWFPGKTLVFPLIHDLPLTPLSKLAERYPTVSAKLRDGKFWTLEAEEELLRVALGK